MQQKSEVGSPARDARRVPDPAIFPLGSCPNASRGGSYTSKTHNHILGKEEVERAKSTIQLSLYFYFLKSGKQWDSQSVPGNLLELDHVDPHHCKGG